MRFLITLSLDLATILATLAKRDHRSIRQEATWLLGQAIQQAAKEQDRAQALDAQEKEYASAP